MAANLSHWPIVRGPKMGWPNFRVSPSINWLCLRACSVRSSSWRMNFSLSAAVIPAGKTACGACRPFGNRPVNSSRRAANLNLVCTAGGPALSTAICRAKRVTLVVCSSCWPMLHFETCGARVSKKGRNPSIRSRSLLIILRVAAERYIGFKHQLLFGLDQRRSCPSC